MASSAEESVSRRNATLTISGHNKWIAKAEILDSSSLYFCCDFQLYYHDQLHVITLHVFLAGAMCEIVGSLLIAWCVFMIVLEDGMYAPLTFNNNEAAEMI